MTTPVGTKFPDAVGTPLTCARDTKAAIVAVEEISRAVSVRGGKKEASMSTIATARAGAASSRMSIAAFASGLATVAVWVLAVSVNDALFLVTAALGVTTVVLGARAWQSARRSGSKGRLALAAMIVGGFPAGAVIVYS